MIRMLLRGIGWVWGVQWAAIGPLTALYCFAQGDVGVGIFATAMATVGVLLIRYLWRTRPASVPAAPAGYHH